MALWGGDFFADLLVEEQVLVELKAVSMLKDEHIAQSLNYLRATGLEICLLINFGTTKVQLKRLRRPVNWKAPSS
jgi:GxxExxY protein